MSERLFADIDALLDHLADVEARLAAAEAECDYADENFGAYDQDGNAWVEVAIIRAALHPDPSDPTGETP